jgi:hypothetical protein
MAQASVPGIGHGGQGRTPHQSRAGARKTRVPRQEPGNEGEGTTQDVGVGPRAYPSRMECVASIDAFRINKGGHGGPHPTTRGRARYRRVRIIRAGTGTRPYSH